MLSVFKDIRCKENLFYNDQGKDTSILSPYHMTVKLCMVYPTEKTVNFQPKNM